MSARHFRPHRYTPRKHFVHGSAPPAYANGKIIFFYNVKPERGKIAIYTQEGQLEKRIDAPPFCRWLLASAEYIFCICTKSISILNYDGFLLHTVSVNKVTPPNYTLWDNSLLFFTEDEDAARVCFKQLFSNGEIKTIYVFEETTSFLDRMNSRWILGGDDYVFAAQAIMRRNYEGLILIKFKVNGGHELVFDKISKFYEVGPEHSSWPRSLCRMDNQLIYVDVFLNRIVYIQGCG